MQIIKKIDGFFVGIYSLIIILVAVFLAFASQQYIFFIFGIMIECVYLYFALRRPFKRFKAIKRSLSIEWKEILNQCSSFYRNLDKTDQLKFERNINIFLSDFSVESIRQQAVDIKLKLLVASGFATLLHGHPEWEPPIKDGVLVYPGETFNKDYEIGKGIRAGQATINSPLIVTSESLKQSFKNPQDGFNVIYHELAHYFDMEDGVANGIPSRRLSPENWQIWKKVIHDEWQKAQKGHSILGSYAATNEAETFAVAVEIFFENPLPLYLNNPQLYNLLKDFFNINTLDIFNSNKKQ